ncbi:MAG: hydrogenase small subunit [Melioribacteraceae bacterium]|nr:hydrogenase small subunit [Melioribacteraceae bacterium]MCF8265454.1 hydrogenase small subunit [Melioribacteraceae bacterium]
MGENKEWTRREFINLFGKGTGLVMGASLFGIPGFNKVFAQAVAEVPVLWLQAGCCTGCSVSVLNSKSPEIQDVLLGEVVPGKHLSMLWHPNVSATQGHDAVKIIQDLKKKPKGSFVLVIEGAISTKDDGIYCEVGEEDGHGITSLQHLKELAPKAMAIISMGTCAAFGGIPAADPNPTGSKPVDQVLEEEGIDTPIINISGCPPHPDWFIGTVATVLIGGLEAIKVDEHKRPVAFYGKIIHDNCPRRGQFDQGNFAKDFGDDGCLYALGCKGPVTHSDCPNRKWNSGVNWPIGSGHPCIGCTEPKFPWGKDMYQQVDVHFATAPSTYPGIINQKDSTYDPLVTGLVGAAAGAAGAAMVMKKKKEQKESGEA